MTYSLHLARGSVAVAPHILLNEMDLPHELVWVDFGAGEQRSEAYARINPKGRVPVLTTGEGRLTEAAAILNFLAARHPEAGFWHDEPWIRARVDEMALFLAATAHVNHAHKLRGARWSDDPAARASMRAKVAANMTETFALIDAALSRSDGPWLLGETYSTADIYIFTVARWLEDDGVAMTDLPEVAAHSAAMQERPAVARTIALHA